MPRALIKDIEILRAIAVLGVIFHHMNGNLLPKISSNSIFSEVLSSGWVGVDLFFAISGFVIARSFVPRATEAGSGKQFRNLSYRFWIVRFFRLAPSAWLWLVIVLVMCAAYNRSGVFGDLRTNIYWTISGVLNFSNYLFVQYFGVQKPGASFVYWSLSLEEQFYLLFPFVMWLFRRHVGWFFLCVVLWQVFERRGLYGMMFRSDAIALGLLVSLVHDHPVSRRIRAALSGTIQKLSTVLLLLLLFYLGSFTQNELPVQVGLVALVSGTLVWLVAGETSLLAGRGFCSSVFLWLGQRSYAMYLVHIPVMFFLRETAFRLGRSPADMILFSGILAMFLIILLAAANFRWVEAPFRLYGKSLAEKLNSDDQPGASSTMVTRK